MNVMRNIRVEKVTLNFGAGKDQKLLAKGMKLIKQLTNIDPVKTITQKRVPTWGLRPGLPIGCKLTLRGNAAKDILKRMLAAKENRLIERNFDIHGNVAFGVHEFIDIPGAKYDPEIGILGVQACITLARPGYSIKSRKIRPKTLSKRHRISKDDAILFMKEKFDVKIGEEE